MTARLISTAKPTFVELPGTYGPILLALHNVLRVQPCRNYPDDRTYIASRGHVSSTCIVSMPYGEVAKLIMAATAT
jgi:hypothetical protein